MIAKDLKQEEIDDIRIKNKGRDLPPGWMYMGALYYDEDGLSQELHPDHEMHIRDYLALKNEVIGDYNQEIYVQK